MAHLSILNQPFGNRYLDALNWIEAKLLSGHRRGIIRLFFWRLPLLFIEGKVLGAFFSDIERTDTPDIDTITIKGSKEIFTFQRFKASFHTVTNGAKGESFDLKNGTCGYYDLHRKEISASEFDFYDYFGLPCEISDGKYSISGNICATREYRCAHFELHVFGGRMELWIVTRKGEPLLENPVSHFNALAETCDRIDDRTRNSIFGPNNIDSPGPGETDAYRIRLLGRPLPLDSETLPIVFSDYMQAAFGNLHAALLAALKIPEGYCRLFITTNDKMHGTGTIIFLTRNQKKFYDRAMSKKEIDASSTYQKLTDSFQSGTVSSIFHQREMAEIFLESVPFYCHPIISKSSLLERDIDGYVYRDELREAEELFLAELPKEDGMGEPNEFLMVPFFFMGHSFGCIAYFVPKKLSVSASDSNKRYELIHTIFKILDERQGHIHQAALQDLSQSIMNAALKESGAGSGGGGRDDYERILTLINQNFASSLFAGRYCTGTEEFFKKRYPDIELKNEDEETPEIVDGKAVRLYKIRDRSTKSEVKEVGFLLCEDRKEFYSPWEKQNDLSIRENIEIAVLSYIQRQRVLRHGVQAAVSAIMSRNHSHHIGSHVTPRTSVAQIRQRLDDLETGADASDYLTIIGVLKDRLDRYIQKKAEFTAEIATNPLLSTKSALLFDDVLLPFIENTLLMDNLGANENIRYTGLGESGIRIHFLVNDMGKEKELIARFGMGTDVSSGRFTSLSYPYTGCQKTAKGIEELVRQRIETLDSHEDARDLDIRVALPGPVGEFAIYSFLENFIRNTMKHNREGLRVSENQPHGLDVYLRAKDLNDDLYSLEIWDTVTKVQKQELLNKYIDQPLVDADGRLVKEGWGMAEMKIMATLLRGSKDFSNMKGYLEAGSVKSINGDECLGYKLSIMKSKEVALVSYRMPLKAYNDLRKKGIWCFPSVAAFKNNMESADRPMAFNFVAIDEPQGDDLSIKNLEGGSATLPFRILVHEDIFQEAFYGCHSASRLYFENIASKQDKPEDIIESTWKEWVEGFPKDGSFDDRTIVLYFEQALNEEPSDSWNDLADSLFDEQVSGSPLALVYQSDSGANLTPDCGSKICLYDRHGQGQSYFQNRGFKPNDVTFYEAFDKNCLDFTSLFARPRGRISYYELLEAALLKVLIVDERIAEVAGDQLNLPHAEFLFGTSRPSRLAVAKRAGIYICTHLQLDNGTMALHTKADRLLLPITARISTANGSVTLGVSENQSAEEPRFHALIVHQGILDTFLEGPVVSAGGQAQFLNGVKSQVPYIVVDSGRGIPPQLPGDFKFLPFSQLEDVLRGPLLAKIRLVQSIMPLFRKMDEP